MTMYQIEIRAGLGWERRGTPFDSKLLADLARAEWLPSQETRVVPVNMEVK